MIVDVSDKFTGQFLNTRFANKFFAEDKRLYPLGNILAFKAGVGFAIDQTQYISEDAINFCIELPGRDRFTTATIHRIFNAGIGSILGTKYLNTPIEIDANKILVNKEFESGGVTLNQGKVSFSASAVVNGAGLLYTGINIKAGKSAPAIAYSSNLTNEQCLQFMNDGINLFYGTMNELFLESVK